MNHPSSALTHLLEHATRERDAAVQRQAQARDLAGRLQAQHDHLLAWRQEFRQQWMVRFTESGQMPVVRSYQSFIDRLGQALQLLERQIEQAHADIEQGRAAVLACEQRAAAIRLLIERRAAQQRLELGRREQRECDEHAAALHLRRVAQAAAESQR